MKYACGNHVVFRKAQEMAEAAHETAKGSGDVLEGVLCSPVKHALVSQVGNEHLFQILIGESEWANAGVVVAVLPKCGVDLERTGTHFRPIDDGHRPLPGHA